MAATLTDVAGYRLASGLEIAWRRLNRGPASHSFYGIRMEFVFGVGSVAMTGGVKTVDFRKTGRLFFLYTSVEMRAISN